MVWMLTDNAQIHLLRCMGGVYEAFIDIDSGKPLSPILVPDDATSSEKQLLEWAQKTLAWLNTPEAGATDEEVGSIFKCKPWLYQACRRQLKPFGSVTTRHCTSSSERPSVDDTPHCPSSAGSQLPSRSVC